MLTAVSIVRTVGAKNYRYIACLVNFSEYGNIVYIQRALMENCGFFSGPNEAPIARHSDRPS